MRTWTRREFIALGAGGVILLAGGAIVRVLNTPAQIVTSRTTTPAPQSNPGMFAQPAITLPLPLWITSNEDFYNVQYNQIPEVSLTSWSLTIYGLVREKLRLTFDEVRALPSVARMHTLECIGNPAGGNLIGNAEWRGVSLKALLERAGVDANATHVTIGGVDEYLTSVPIARALNEHAMLAFEMNGQPLPLKHGFPLRAILPGVYGQKQPKWVTGIHVTDQEELGYWEQQGWSREAVIQLNSGIKIPSEGKPLVRGDLLVAGVAHASEIGVRSVEVSIDGGRTWNEATLTRGTTPYVWTPWGYVFRNVSAGQWRLMVRATDNAGVRQDQMEAGILADVFPNGTSAIHSILIDVI